MINPVQSSKYLITNNSKARQFVTSLGKKGALLPVLLLEATVTGGRTYQAYQRDGFVEARERVTEEFLGAVFWIFGAQMFGKLFDLIGNKFFKMPKNMPDIGVDKARTPFHNYIKDISATKKLTTAQSKTLKNKLASYSVGKTIASILTACAFIGFVVPKLNQAITKHLYGKMDKIDPKHEKAPDPHKNKLTLKDARTLFSAKGVSINAVENFKANKNKNILNNQNPNFKGLADKALRVIQNFEENPIWQLLGTDVGTISGRTFNARNVDERVEIMFRDIVSIFFYVFSTPFIVAGLHLLDKFRGQNTKLNPESARNVHNKLIQKMQNIGLGVKEITNPKTGEITKDLFGEIPIAEFKKFALGERLDKNLYQKFFEKPMFVEKKRFFGLLKPKKVEVIRTITLDKFKQIVDTNITDLTKAQKLKDLGERMSEVMQPAKQGEKLLTSFQVKDILQGGFLREPEVLSELLNDALKPSEIKKLFKTNVNEQVPQILTNPYKYTSIETINEKRNEILNYAKSIIKDALNNRTNITAKRMLELNKRNLKKSGIFMGAGIGVSALFLSTIIPKVQYYITYKRTGKRSFPGTENLQK